LILKDPTLAPALQLCAAEGHVMQRRSRIGAEDITKIAWVLIDKHGTRAPAVADRIIGELDEEGEAFSAACWRILRTLIDDALAGRLDRRAVTLH